YLPRGLNKNSCRISFSFFSFSLSLFPSFSRLFFLPFLPFSFSLFLSISLGSHFVCAFLLVRLSIYSQIFGITRSCLLVEYDGVSKFLGTFCQFINCSLNACGRKRRRHGRVSLWYTTV